LWGKRAILGRLPGVEGGGVPVNLFLVVQEKVVTWQKKAIHTSKTGRNVWEAGEAVKKKS